MTSPTPEPTLESIQREFPGWVCWQGVSGMVCARRAVDRARAELEDIGVRSIGVDHLRQVGRGIRTQIPSVRFKEEQPEIYGAHRRVTTHREFEWIDEVDLGSDERAF